MGQGRFGTFSYGLEGMALIFEWFSMAFLTPGIEIFFS